MPPNSFLLVHLSGPHRGTSQPLQAGRVVLGSGRDADVHFPADEEPGLSGAHAVLERQDATYRVVAAEGAAVYVNGQQVEERELASGDVLEMGAGGPVLRLRCYQGCETAHKSLTEALRDCVDCARYGSESWWARSFFFLRWMPRELFTQTTPAVRSTAAVVLLVLLAGMGGVGYQVWTLEQRLDAEALRVEALRQVVRGTEKSTLTPDEVTELRAELEARVSQAMARVETLESRSEATRRIVSRASGSVVFLQGAYGFEDPDTGRPVRARVGSTGELVRGPDGRPTVGPDVSGPVYQHLYTGTAFVVREDGLLLTNRHVALPWDYAEAARSMSKQGYRPVMRRLVGYLPGREEPLEVRLVLAADSADVATLRLENPPAGLQPLPLSREPPRPGEEVVVLGYPAGIRALVARAGRRVASRLVQEHRFDFWGMARRLAREGRIAPLATRGIVGQVTPQVVVYDAETTQGGSGGPVIGVDGEVVGVNEAVMREFGGSNLGVPVLQARRLLRRLEDDARR